ncbi:MAG: hypothetical protein ABFD50_20030 [Smithella sp.]
MTDHEILSGMKTLTADELMGCYQAAFDQLDEADKGRVLACVDKLLPIKNMGIVSAWELIAKMGILFQKQRAEAQG